MIAFLSTIRPSLPKTMSEAISSMLRKAEGLKKDARNLGSCKKIPVIPIERGCEAAAVREETQNELLWKRRFRKGFFSLNSLVSS